MISWLAVETSTLQPRFWAISGISGALGIMLSLAIVLSYRDVRLTLNVVPAVLTGRDPNTIPSSGAIGSYLIVGIVGGMVYISIWPTIHQAQPLGGYHSAIAATIIGTVIFAVYAVLAPRRLNIDDMNRLRQRWFFAIAIYAMTLVITFPTIAHYVGPYFI